MHTSSAVFKISVGQDKTSKLYCQQNQDNSLIVIFPDENYSSERPLLYYARKVALMEGHDVLCINYKRKLTWRQMGLCTIDLEADSITDTIKKCLRKEYKNIFFLSKGIGTEVAGIVSSRLGYEKITSVFLEPTNQIVKHIVNSKCIVVVGTDDGIFTQDYLNQIKEHKNVELILIKDANRYLEISDNINRTLEVLGQMTTLYTRLFKATPDLLREKQV